MDCLMGEGRTLHHSLPEQHTQVNLTADNEEGEGRFTVTVLVANALLFTVCIIIYKKKSKTISSSLRLLKNLNTRNATKLL